MTAHKGAEDVARYGCRALGNIAFLPAGQQAAVDAGAPAAIVAAITAHKRDADVAHFGCWTLSRIALLPAGKSAVISAGGRAAVEAAVASHADAKEPGAAALAALK